MRARSLGASSSIADDLPSLSSGKRFIPKLRRFEGTIDQLERSFRDLVEPRALAHFLERLRALLGKVVSLLAPASFFQ